MTLFLAEYDTQDRTGHGGGVAGEYELITPTERAVQDFSDAADCGAVAYSKLHCWFYRYDCAAPSFLIERSDGQKVEFT